MTASKERKQLAAEACRVLNTLVGDLQTARGTLGVMERVHPDPSDTLRVYFMRMIYTHVLLVLTKWREAYLRYQAIIPEDLRDEAKRVVAEIDKRRIVRFRNSSVGHILDKTIGRALTLAETDQRFREMIGEPPEAFLDWVHMPGRDAPDTVCSIIMRVRDRIGAEYGIDAPYE